MRRVYACSLFLAVLFGGTVSAALNPVGTYTLTFERDGWSASKDLSVVFMVPGDDTVYEPFYNDPATGTPTRVYLEEVAQPEPDIHSFTWYVNSPAVLDDPSTRELLGGTGPLTISVTGLTFEGGDPDVMFQPLVTHIYYVGYNGSEFVPKEIPGHIPVDPGVIQRQRSAVLPLAPSEPDYNPLDPLNPFYGTPYENLAGPDVSFVLPEMYVPSNTDGTVWELSFGAGFSVVPEPATIGLLVTGGLLILGRRRRR